MAINGYKMPDGTFMAKTLDGEYVPIGKFRDVPYDSRIFMNPMGEFKASKPDCSSFVISAGRINGKTHTMDNLLKKGDIEKAMGHDNFITTFLTHVARATNEAPFTPKSIEVSVDHRTVVVVWVDGTKTIVKRSKNDPDDIYMAFTAALAKKIFGTNSHVKKVIASKINQHLPKEKKGEA